MNASPRLFTIGRKSGMGASASLAIALTVALASGCATTTAFQKSAANVGPHLAADAARYVAADKTTDAATLGLRSSEATALGAATADSSSVTAQGTYDAWSAVEPWYRAYIAADADPTMTPARRSLRLGRCDTFDDLIAHEARRPIGPGTRPAAK